MCDLCSKLSGESPVQIVFEDTYAVALVPEHILVPGHLVVIPKTHVFNIGDLAPEIYSSLHLFIQRVVVTLEETHGIEGVSLLHTSGIGLFDGSEHLQFHLLPRYKGDGVDIWPNVKETHNIYI